MFSFLFPKKVEKTEQVKNISKFELHIKNIKNKRLYMKLRNAQKNN